MNNFFLSRAFKWQSVMFIVGGLAVIGVASVVLEPHHWAYMGVHPHPFWAVVLFVAVRFGFKEGVTAALVAAGLYIGSVLLAGKDPYYFSSLRLFDDFGEPILFVLVAAFVSQVTEREMAVRLSHRLRMKRQLKEIKTLKQRYESADSALQLLGERITGQYSDILDIFDSMASTKGKSSEEINLHMLKTMGSYLHATQCTLHSVSDGHIVEKLVYSDGLLSPGDGQKKQAVLLAESLKTKKVSYISALSEEDLIKHRDGPLICGPILAGGKGAVVGIASVDQLAFAHYTQYTIKFFTVLLNWWGHILEERRRMEDLHKHTIYNEEIGLYNYAYCVKRLSAEFTRSREYDMPLSLGFLRIRDFAKLNPTKKPALETSVPFIVSQFLGEMDMVASFEQPGLYAVVMPGVSWAEAKKKIKPILDEIESYKFQPYQRSKATLTLDWAGVGLKASHSDPLGLIREALAGLEKPS